MKCAEYLRDLQEEAARDDWLADHAEEAIQRNEPLSTIPLDELIALRDRLNRLISDMTRDELKSFRKLARRPF